MDHPHSGFDALQRLRLERGALHLHRLGAQATSELLAELATEHGIGPAILARLASYQRITPAMLHAAGGALIPRQTPRLVPRELRAVRA